MPTPSTAAGGPAEVELALLRAAVLAMAQTLPRNAAAQAKASFVAEADRWLSGRELGDRADRAGAAIASAILQALGSPEPNPHCVD